MYDIVCGMKLGEKPPYKSLHKKKVYYFCSKECRDSFKKDPKKYINHKPVIEFKDVSKSFKMGKKVTVPVLHNLSLRVWKGDFVALIGTSGSGKSTAMNLMGLLDTPTTGKVYIDGNEASKMSPKQLAHLRNEKIGFVFQQFNLLGALNCRENISLPMFFKKGKSKATKSDGNVDKLIGNVGLEDRIKHKPLEMSGGEQQRAAIARALVDDPEVILADEPTGNLDSKTGQLIMELFDELSEKGRTLVVITHDPEIAKRAKKILSLKDGRLIINHGGIKKSLWKSNNKPKPKKKK